MPKTLLAVDDSATMRKVLEITFSGDDFEVVTADGREAALAKLEGSPSVVLVDTSLGGDDGYALGKEIRERAPNAVVLLMASRFNPYDAGRGRDAGADDYLDKPFDTQQAIEKVKKALLARESSAPAAAAAPPPAPKPPVPTAVPTATVPSLQNPMAAAAAPRPAAPGGPPPAPVARPVAPAAPPPRAPTMAFEESATFQAARAAQSMTTSEPPTQAARPAPPPTAPAPSNTAATVTPPPPAPTPIATPAATPAARVASSVNGQLNGKLGELGLTPAQVEAVLALSREVVERVVWEVVPQLAETIIKEEVARLTRE